MLNNDDSKCLHIGIGNNQSSYQLGRTEVPIDTQEHDLGVHKVSEQCAKVTTTANEVLGIIMYS